MNRISTFLIAVLIFTSCSSEKVKSIPFNKTAIALNDSALRVAHVFSDTSKIVKGLELINEAILIDSSNVRFYENKLVFLVSLKKYKEAIIVTMEIESFGVRPYLITQRVCSTRW